MKLARHFKVGYIHNQSSIKSIYVFFVVIKTDLSQQQPLKWLKMHYMGHSTRNVHYLFLTSYSEYKIFHAKNSKTDW